MSTINKMHSTLNLTKYMMRNKYSQNTIETVLEMLAEIPRPISLEVSNKTFKNSTKKHTGRRVSTRS